MLTERFWSKVAKTDTCWLWTASLNTSGYGQFHLGNATPRAHRLAYAELRGPIPEGLVLDHLCRVRHCVNPDHLEPVTLVENFMRGVRIPPPNGVENAAKTHCMHAHEFTPENTIRRSNGGRACRECNRRNAREYQRRKRSAVNYAQSVA